MSCYSCLEQVPKPFLTAEWRWLAVLNYEIEPAVLAPHIPAGTELDIWNGRCFVSLVGFLFLNTRVLGMPIPFHRNFEEVNLRFYVRCKSTEGWRRGVVFIKEIVPRRAIAAIARWVYNENYEAMPMRHKIDGDNFEYQWLYRDALCSLAVTRRGEPFPPAPNSEEEFITEHYWGYCKQPAGGSVEYKVEHPGWRVWRANRATANIPAEQLYGPEFAEALGGTPLSALLAEGSAVAVHSAVRIA